ncbi:MAG: hypothetical protein K0U93_27655, partial [Gammaproteobacteria bacterium]|nr:hypothetical protein [Gammaproteobacteria bacterium]
LSTLLLSTLMSAHDLIPDAPRFSSTPRLNCVNLDSSFHEEATISDVSVRAIPSLLVQWVG